MLRKCPSCSKKNRIPAARLADTGRCGSCKEKLPPIDVPLDVGREAFDEIIAGAKVPILVDFWAEWCMPCKRAAPEVKKVAKQVAGKALVLKVDTERSPDLAQRYQVKGIPNFAVFEKGDVVFQQAGLVDHRQMKAWLLPDGG